MILSHVNCVFTSDFWEYKVLYKCIVLCTALSKNLSGKNSRNIPRNTSKLMLNQFLRQIQIAILAKSVFFVFFRKKKM